MALKPSQVIGKVRSDAGRQGRGENAHSAREAHDWRATLWRIERIVKRATRAGAETMRERVLKLPIKAVRL